MLCIESEWKNRTCSTDEDGYHGGEYWFLQELTAFFKASNISTRGKSGPSLSRSLVVSHGCFLPMGLGHPLLLGSNRRISVAWIPYGANEGLSGEGKASRRALSGSLEPSWFRLAKRTLIKTRRSRAIQKWKPCIFLTFKSKVTDLFVSRKIQSQVYSLSSDNLKVIPEG